MPKSGMPLDMPKPKSGMPTPKFQRPSEALKAKRHIPKELARPKASVIRNSHEHKELDSPATSPTVAVISPKEQTIELQAMPQGGEDRAAKPGGILSTINSDSVPRSSWLARRELSDDFEESNSILVTSHERFREMSSDERKLASKRGSWLKQRSDTPFCAKLFLSLIQVAGSIAFYLALEYARDDDTETENFDTISGIVVSTILQMLVLIPFALRKEYKSLGKVHWPTFWYSCVAGFFWCAYEILTAHSVLLCGASAAAMVQQSRVVFQAILRTFMMKSPITELHWHGLAMLAVSIVGCMFLLVDEDMEGSSPVAASWKKNVLVEVRRGTILCVVASLSYSLAMVLTEKLYRDPRFGHISFEAKFLHIVSRKLFFSALYFLVYWWTHGLKLFQGWTEGYAVVPTGLFLQTISSHVAMLRLDALLSCLCEVFVAAAVYAIEIFFGKELSPVELCFMLLVIQCVGIFTRISVKLARAEAQKKIQGYHDWNAIDAVETGMKNMLNSPTLRKSLAQPLTTLKQMKLQRAVE